MGNTIKSKEIELSSTTTQSSETILEKEMKAFQELELLDITPAFINRFGIENITKKIDQQYFWFYNNEKSNPDKYISLKDWNLRYVWS